MTHTYQGSCHCGFIQFEVIADIDHVRQCDCTICLKRAALNFRVSKDNLKLKTSLKDLSIYQWGMKTAKDYFCPKCGILPFRKPSSLTPSELNAGKIPFSGWAINVRCLDGLDISKLPVIKIDGASL